MENEKAISEISNDDCFREEDHPEFCKNLKEYILSHAIPNPDEFYHDFVRNIRSKRFIDKYGELLLSQTDLFDECFLSGKYDNLIEVFQAQIALMQEESQKYSRFCQLNIEKTVFFQSSSALDSDIERKNLTFNVDKRRSSFYIDIYHFIDKLNELVHEDMKQRKQIINKK